MKHFLLPLAILCSTILLAQTSDCVTGLNICNKDSFSFDYSFGKVRNESTTLDAQCFRAIGVPPDLESSPSIWIKWRVATSGTLTFTITPENYQDDIDFAVYKIRNDTCGNKSAVRCMATGISADCERLGPTGLRESEQDVSETIGCTTPQNNFLAPLNVLAGELYVLFIINATNSAPTKSKISFGGTALFECNTTTSLTKNDDDKLLKVYPNPVNDQLSIESNDPLSRIMILNNLGQVLIRKELLQDITNPINLSLKHLLSGHYIIHAEMKNGMIKKEQFVKL
jgi:Secretion system C-terminal sorting domain